MALITSLLASFQKDEEGQGLAEYALILALIAIVAIVALIFLGNQVSRSCRRSATRSSRSPNTQHEGRRALFGGLRATLTSARVSARTGTDGQG